MRRFAATLSFSLLLVAVACNDAGPPPVAPTTATAPVTTVIVDGGAPLATTSSVAASDPPPVPASAGDGGADFYSCSVDSDCVAVPRVGCCPNGSKEAVNKLSADAYRNSFVCEKTRHICPMYRLLNRRLPLCGNESHRCEMVQPAQVVCNGSGPNVHACPGGAACDATGHCPAGP